MAGELDSDLCMWADRIGEWHRMAFPWAKLPHILDKLSEEKREANLAWSNADNRGVADELADCLICILAAMSREGVDPASAVEIKFAQVSQKYNREQPQPCQAELFAF